ncbi:MAG: hypothetical protein AB1427_08110 [Thermodesulfobacteriota bacterium]
MKFKAFLIAITSVFLAATGVPADTASAPQPPAAFLPATTFSFPEVVEGSEVVHEFIILNRGTGPLNVQKVETA